MRRIVLVCALVLGVLAFAVEPTTSTALDIQEGRAHGAFVSASSTLSSLTAAGALQPSRTDSTVLALAAVIALLLAGVSFTAESTPVRRLGSWNGWATTARRGPPARV